MLAAQRKLSFFLYSNRVVQAAKECPPSLIPQYTLDYISHDLWLKLIEEDIQNKFFSRYGSNIEMLNSGPLFIGNYCDFINGIRLMITSAKNKV